VTREWLDDVDVSELELVEDDSKSPHFGVLLVDEAFILDFIGYVCRFC